MNTKFLVLQFRPEDDASDGEFEAMLRFGRIRPEEVERVRMEQGAVPSLDVKKYNGILAGGGPFSISDLEEKKGAVGKMVEGHLFPIVEEIVSSDIPFLGACYGLGALVKVLGGTVSKNGFAEAAGATDIIITSAGKSDALLVGLESPFRAFTGHKEACESVPESAVLLATSPQCPVQMIRVKQHVYATQFHPELDPQGIRVRIDAYRHHGYFASEEAESLKEACLREHIIVPLEILRRFVERARKVSEKTLSCYGVLG
ncbi:MAG: glutamine amidotransferase [Candidatus Moraniibacteriota bacterium]